MRRYVLSISTGLLIATLVGCSQMSMPKPRLPMWINPAPASIGERPAEFTPYPADVERGDDLDIVVTRRRDHIALENRTARSYADLQLWLNQQYVAHIDNIAIGDGNRIPLTQFVNRHGEHYPIAGLLTPDKAFPVLVVEAYDPDDGKRHRLFARPLLARP